MSTLEQRIADVIEAIASEFKKRDAITTSNASNNSGIDEKTLNRIMRCVHAWEKSVDTDGDGLKDYDEYELHGTNPDKQDTDDDDVMDDTEVRLGFNPLDANNKPDIPKMVDFEFKTDRLNNLIITPLGQNGTYNINNLRIALTSTNATGSTQHFIYDIVNNGQSIQMFGGGLLYFNGEISMTVTIESVTLTKRYMIKDRKLTPIN